MAIPAKHELGSLCKRLLSDINEIERAPYPGIKLHIEDDLTRACLSIKPQGEPPLHLTLRFGNDYPLNPPHITIQSKISHPNVFGSTLCISLLNTDEGYTPAYTLRGICIQLLSFFGSDTVEQMWGEHGGLVDRKKWQSQGRDGLGRTVVVDAHQCERCGFGHVVGNKISGLPKTTSKANTVRAPSRFVKDTNGRQQQGNAGKRLKDLPNEVLLLVCEHLDDESLFRAAAATNAFSDLIHQHNVIRTRELICFTFKTGFNESNLGVGVHIRGRSIESEFDLLSLSAFRDHNIRHSIHGLPFEHWLPLPLAQKHWDRVKTRADTTLNAVARSIGNSSSIDDTLYSFMNGVVVRLSAASGESGNRSTQATAILGGDGAFITSNLTHASEKAIESYFQLYHLLICLAVDQPAIADHADRLITNFVAGNRSKASCPNIGHLLIAILISEVEVTDELVKAIINETVTRNVVWMLEGKPRGQGMPEMAFLETDAISHYRLQKTFEAGKTGYKLLMFLNLMRKVVRAARNDKNGNKMTLKQLRDTLFDRHGAPPSGAAARMAEEIRAIQKVNDFPNFLTQMGMAPPKATSFTAFLRGTVEQSMKLGYSKNALDPQQTLYLRMLKEPTVGAPEGVTPFPVDQEVMRHVTFFPERGGYRGGRAVRGRGKARDRRTSL